MKCDFRAFDPPTIEACAQVWRGKVWHSLLRSLSEARDGDLFRAWEWLGRADAAVSVLYDTNHPAAYHAHQRHQLVAIILRRLTHDRAEKLGRSLYGL